MIANQDFFPNPANAFLYMLYVDYKNRRVVFQNLLLTEIQKCCYSENSQRKVQQFPSSKDVSCITKICIFTFNKVFTSLTRNFLVIDVVGFKISPLF